MKRFNSQGMVHLEIIVAVVVSVAVAVVAWQVHNRSTPTSAGDTVATAMIPATIASTADLQKASNALDSTAIDSNLDTSSLDSAVDNLY